VFLGRLINGVSQTCYERQSCHRANLIAIRPFLPRNESCSHPRFVLTGSGVAGFEAGRGAGHFELKGVGVKGFGTLEREGDSMAEEVFGGNEKGAPGWNLFWH
jgi:hypothetical protein